MATGEEAAMQEALQLELMQSRQGRHPPLIQLAQGISSPQQLRLWSWFLPTGLWTLSRPPQLPRHLHALQVSI